MRGGLIAQGAALVALLAASPAAEATVTPTTCGNLQADMEAASAGEVLQLPAGTCQANVTLTNTNAFALKGASGGTILEPQTGQSSTPIIQSSADVHFTLSGLTLTGDTGTALSLSGTGGEAVTLIGNKFLHDGGTGVGGAIHIEHTSATASEPTVLTGNVFTGDSAGLGGGLYWDSGQPLVVSGNTFTSDGAGGSGGGLFVWSFTANTSHVQISGNTFGGSTQAAGNTAGEYGGGAFVALNAGQTLLLAHNKFESNRITGNHTASGPREGAGLYVGVNLAAPYPVTQTGNEFRGNVIDETESSGRSTDAAGGAGEWISGLTAQSTGDVFAQNRIAANDGAPPEGGGVGAFASAPYGPSSVPAEPGAFVARDDVFSGNSTAAGGWGGAIYVGGPSGDCTGTCPGSSVTLQDSTVVGNRVDPGAGSEGGAIWGSPNDKLSATNSIIYGNTPKPEIFGFASHPPTVSHSDLCGVPGVGDICQDPKLAASGAETKTAPTIDVGSNALVPAGLTRDILGNPRIASCTGPGHAVVDMGAFELQPVLGCDPKVLIKSRKLSAKQGKVRVKLRCPHGYQYCDGTVTLSTKLNGHKTLKLGSANFHIVTGKTSKVSVKLLSGALSKLGTAGSVNVVIKVKDHDGLHHKAKSHRSVVLKLL